MQLQTIRRQRHSAVADVMIGLGPASAPVDAGALAHHLEQAERIEEAVDAHVLAAGESMGQGGIAEAIAQFDHAIELVERVGNDQARLGLELTVRQARGMAWAFARGLRLTRGRRRSANGARTSAASWGQRSTAFRGSRRRGTTA